MSCNNISDGMPIAYHVTFETPFVSQHICQQELMNARWYSIYAEKNLGLKLKQSFVVVDSRRRKEGHVVQATAKDYLFRPFIFLKIIPVLLCSTYFTFLLSRNCSTSLLSAYIFCQYLCPKYLPVNSLFYLVILELCKAEIRILHCTVNLKTFFSYTCCSCT